MSAAISIVMTKQISQYASVSTSLIKYFVEHEIFKLDRISQIVIAVLQERLILYLPYFASAKTEL